MGISSSLWISLLVLSFRITNQSCLEPYTTIYYIFYSRKRRRRANMQCTSFSRNRFQQACIWRPCTATRRRKFPISRRAAACVIVEDVLASSCPPQACTQCNSKYNLVSGRTVDFLYSILFYQDTYSYLRLRLRYPQ